MLLLYIETQVAIQSIPLIELIPARLSSYYRYEGSLTTPPCYESVSWTLFNETIEIAEEQVRSLFGCSVKSTRRLIFAFRPAMRKKYIVELSPQNGLLQHGTNHTPLVLFNLFVVI